MRIDVAHDVGASFGNAKITLKYVSYLTTSIAVFYEIAVDSQSEKSHVRILYFTSDDKHSIVLSHISCIATLNVKLKYLTFVKDRQVNGLTTERMSTG